MTLLFQDAFAINRQKTVLVPRGEDFFRKIAAILEQSDVRIAIICCRNDGCSQAICVAGGAYVSQFQVDDRVRLIHDIPDLLLHRGDEGVVTSVWFAPEYAYEVEFRGNGGKFPVRKVCQAEQVEAATSAVHHGGVPETGSVPGYTSRG
jgi:Domain of unknown function (DUF4926)